MVSEANPLPIRSRRFRDAMQKLVPRDGYAVVPADGGRVELRKPACVRRCGAGGTRGGLIIGGVGKTDGLLVSSAVLLVQP